MKAKTRESISLAMRFHIMRRDKFTCQYCGAKAPDAALHVEHIKPVVDGGNNDPKNLCAACVRCNLGKGTKAAQSEEERPFTERERQLQIYYEWFLGHHGIWSWAADIYCGEDPEVRLVLLGLAGMADPMGGVVAMKSDICRKLHLPLDKLNAILHGLEAVGLIDRYEDEHPWAEMAISLHWTPVREKEDEHIPLRTLSEFRFFATAERIYG